MGRIQPLLEFRNTLAMPRFHLLFATLVGLLVTTLTGCVASRDTIEQSLADAQNDSFHTASASRDVPVVFTDNKALQYDTGAMDSDAPRQFQTTDSGLRYRILRKSNGAKPTASNSVTVHYRGWLDSGKVFDSSYDRGEPATFGLGQVVAGWTEGMQLIGVGGMIELWVPARLGYGTTGSGGDVPPNATLHFVVELLEVR